MLEQLITNAFILHNWINEKLHDLEIPSDQRTLLAVLSYDVVIEHHISIATLVSSKFNSSAFALVRPLIETFVRAAWLRHCATDKQINEYATDTINFRTLNIDQLIKEVERNYGVQDQSLSEIHKKTWKTMCSYTHGGLQQASHRIENEYIEPNFSLEEIIEVIQFSKNLAILAFQQIAVDANCIDLADEASSLYTKE